MNRIILFSRPVRSGKTTELMHAYPLLGSVGGVLCPDKGELCWLYSISEKFWDPLQSPRAIRGETLEIGRFHFFMDGFENARNLLLRDAEQGFDWLIVDEVGKLEMRNKQGLEPALGQLISGYKSGQYQGKLLLVVRDFLVNEVKSYYGLPDCEVIDTLQPWINK
ncbi:MAG TPA: hypothetical protein DIW47_05980 [Bacteroidetes bacterium]|nr:hypothetical protein [Bacteroidota bacterium]